MAPTLGREKEFLEGVSMSTFGVAVGKARAPGPRGPVIAPNGPYLKDSMTLKRLYGPYLILGF